MLKKSFTYTNFDGVEATETCYFNLSETELMEWQLSEDGGLAGRLQEVIDAKDTARLASFFKQLILKAYGEKSADGRYFMKSEEISNRFACTPMYDQLYMELMSDANEASAFTNGIMPQKLVEQANQQNSRQSIAPAN